MIRRRKEQEPLEEQTLVIPLNGCSPDIYQELSLLLQELPGEQREAIYLGYYPGFLLRWKTDMDKQVPSMPLFTWKLTPV